MKHDIFFFLDRSQQLILPGSAMHAELVSVFLRVAHVGLPQLWDQVVWAMRRLASMIGLQSPQGCSRQILFHQP